MSKGVVENQFSKGIVGHRIEPRIYENLIQEKSCGKPGWGKKLWETQLSKKTNWKSNSGRDLWEVKLGKWFVGNKILVGNHGKPNWAKKLCETQFHKGPVGNPAEQRNYGKSNSGRDLWETKMSKGFVGNHLGKGFVGNRLEARVLQIRFRKNPMGNQTMERNGGELTSAKERVGNRIEPRSYRNPTQEKNCGKQNWGKELWET